MGLLIFGIGLVLAIISPSVLAQYLFKIEALIAFVGLACLFYPNFGATVCAMSLSECNNIPLVQKSLKLGDFYKKLLFSSDFLCILVGQICLMLISFVFFNTLELQTRLSPRLQPVELGYFFNSFKHNAILLGFVPWIIYAVVGVGLCYFTTVLKRTPYLPKIIFPEHKNQPKAFFYNFLCLIIEGGCTYPIIFITAFSMIYACETINTLAGWNSLFATPFITLFAMALLLLGFRKVKSQLIDTMVRYNLTVGLILIAYILVFGTLLLTLYNVGENFFPNNRGVQLQALTSKSLAASFTEQELSNRLQLLFWGWWAIWTPWMSSFIARFSMNHSIRHALLSAIIFPAIFFCFIMNKLTLNEWMVFNNVLQGPWVKALITIFILTFIMVCWGRMRTTADISRGFMPPLGKWRFHPLKKWMTGLMIWLACFLPSWFMSGWIPVQIFSTLNAGFTVILLMFFIVVLLRNLPKKTVFSKYIPEMV